MIPVPVLLGAGAALGGLIWWLAGFEEPVRSRSAQEWIAALTRSYPEAGGEAIEALVDVAIEQGLDPAALAAVIHFESGLHWDPKAVGGVAPHEPGPAVGLIQFLPRRAARIGWTPAQITALSAADQIRGPVRDWLRYVGQQRPYDRRRWWDAMIAVYDWQSVGQGIDDPWLNAYVPAKWPTLRHYVDHVLSYARLDPRKALTG